MAISQKTYFLVFDEYELLFLLVSMDKKHARPLAGGFLFYLSFKSLHHLVLVLILISSLMKIQDVLQFLTSFANDRLTVSILLCHPFYN